MGVPEDAMRAARAARSGALNANDEMAAALEFSVSQIQPALGRLEEALGAEVDSAGFAMGMLAAGFTMNGVDVIEAAALMPVQFAEFLTMAAAQHGRAVCAARPVSNPSVTCWLDPGHKGQHAAGRLRW